MKQLYALVVFALVALSAQSQQIISVAPNTVSPGSQATVLVTTTGIYLSPSATIDFGTGITVTNTEIIQNYMIRATINVSAQAATGNRTIKVTSETNNLEYPNFEVMQTGGSVTAFMDVIPVQKLYLTDLDPNNPENAPLLFYVTISNDNQTRNLEVFLTVRGESTGEWGTASKSIASLAPNTTFRFNNKEFDKYKVNTANRNKLEEAAKQGRLPTDVYEYFVEVKDKNGNTLTETSGRNIIDNPIARPELIGPGTPLNLQPEEVTTATPFFQWFSQAATHTISVYPVFKNQTTREEITLNRPMWTQTDVSGKNIIYPVSAEILQEGTTYAWQITGIISGAKGDEKIYSDVFWFTYKKSGLKTTTYARIVIEPELPVVKTGKSQKFTVYGIDDNNMRYDISDKVVWKVLPASMGVITATGNFTAGKYADNIAVVAQYGSEQVFADVTVENDMAAMAEAWDMGAFLKTLFGLP